jgi:hypothetical protein
MNRRVTPKVKNGKVQKKHRHDRSPTVWDRDQETISIIRQNPEKGYRHFLTKSDMVKFIGIIPEWDELSKGLNFIVLEKESYGYDGACFACGTIIIAPWSRDKWIKTSAKYYHDHEEILGKLSIECKKENKLYLCKFEDNQIIAFQLLHVFLHELGHHHDRMTTRAKTSLGRGEKYAETYAQKYETIIWNSYFEEFEL